MILAQALGENLDYAVMFGYFIAIMGFGLCFSRYNKTTKDYCRFNLMSFTLLGLFVAVRDISVQRGFEFAVALIIGVANDEFLDVCELTFDGIEP